MGYLLGIVLALAVGVFAYLILGPEAVIPAMVVTCFILLGFALTYFAVFHYDRRITGEHVLELLQTHPLKSSDETAIDPILHLSVGNWINNREVEDLIKERVAQWKVWHPRE